MQHFGGPHLALSYGLDTTTKIKQALICEFQKYDLELSFRKVNTSENNAWRVFLDVEHKIDSDFAGGFYTWRGDF